MPTQTPAKRLRSRLSTGELLFVPGVYNALVARVMERSGFDAVYTGGYAASAANFALPDIGLMTQTEMCDHIGRIAKAISLPIIADADTGFGGVTNVARTVNAYEAAGAAAVQIEDQTFPKRCGHLDGKSVIDRAEMVRKVRAAVAARSDPDTVIVARSDAIAVTGLNDAIERMRAYADAGADLIFPDAPRSIEELATIVEAIEQPLVVNFSEHGRTPLLSAGEAAELGFAVALYPTTALFAAVHSAFEIAETLRRDGTSRDALDRLTPFDELNDLLGLSAWQQKEDAEGL